ncbi:hypothetical protein SBD_1590 [Streptomyces bottropensis ATCC 25435]|uniref:Uncharacterized protein n=1 Tax=Streptomyces bottropensis ATCC 25435 TaxID=1054862 RepID=M3FXS5_9ACTN|nr:hypothetical protein SBD_1590 [Streptomyces bottropensis ATCC 25435]
MSGQEGLEGQDFRSESGERWTASAAGSAPEFAHFAGQRRDDCSIRTPGAMIRCICPVAAHCDAFLPAYCSGQ